MRLFVLKLVILIQVLLATLVAGQNTEGGTYCEYDNYHPYGPYNPAPGHTCLDEVDMWDVATFQPTGFNEDPSINLVQYTSLSSLVPIYSVSQRPNILPQLVNTVVGSVKGTYNINANPDAFGDPYIHQWCPDSGGNGVCFANNGQRATLECQSNYYGLFPDYFGCWEVYGGYPYIPIPGPVTQVPYSCLYQCPSDCLICNTGLGSPNVGTPIFNPNSLSGCQDTNPSYQTLLLPPQHMYATYQLSTAVQVNCRMTVCGSEHGTGCLFKTCTNAAGYLYVNYPSGFGGPGGGYYKSNMGLWVNWRCSCSDSFPDDFAPNWYCTVANSSIPNPGNDVDIAIDNGDDVRVICITNANYFAANGTGTKPYLCLDTVTDLILGLGPWPVGVYMVINGSPVVDSSYKGYWDYYQGTFDNQIPGTDWGCFDGTTCAQYEPVLYLFEGCVSGSPTAFAAGFEVPDFSVFLSQVCEWQPMVQSIRMISSNLQNIKTNTYSLVGSFPNVPHPQLYTNAYSGGVSICRTISWSTGQPVVSSSLQPSCSLDPTLSTAVLYPGYAINDFAPWYASWWSIASINTNAVKPAANNPVLFTPLVQTGDAANTVPSYFGVPFFDTFVNEPVGCPSKNPGQQLLQLVGYGILTLTANFTHVYTPPTGWGDPGYNSDWSLDSDLNDFILAQDTKSSRPNTNAFNHGGSMFWSHFDPSQCGCSITKDVLYYSNVTGQEGCYALEHFCVPGHCLCQQSYFEMPWPVAEDYTMHTGAFYNQLYGSNALRDSSTFSYRTNIKCTTKNAISHSCDYTKHFASSGTVGSNTTCVCLNGWAGQKCDVCDPQKLVPWFDDVTCAVTCRSPDGSVIGHQACQNGGKCMYNANTDSASCVCASNYAGAYCQYPIALTLGCSQGLLPFSCQLAPVAGQFISAFYACSLPKHGIVLPSYPPFTVYATMPSVVVSFSPPTLTDAQQLWVQPLLTPPQLCPSLFHQIFNNQTAPNQYAFYCPMPYNTIYNTSYSDSLDTWCQLSGGYPKVFTVFQESIFCYALAFPIGLAYVSNISYTWCHSLPSSLENRMECLMHFPTSVLLSTMTLNYFYTMAYAQCQSGTPASISFFNQYDNCAADSCLNGATCKGDTGLSGNYTCTCAYSYTGPHCEHLIDNCLVVNPCQHAGVCVTDYGTNNSHCVCNANYTGIVCELPKICQLDGNPCQNGGACNNTFYPSNYTCICPTGYNGTLCEYNNVCATYTCPAQSNYGATCISSGSGTYVCDYCSTRNPCLNGGICKNTYDFQGFVCTCAGPYSGVYCGVHDKLQYIGGAYACSAHGGWDGCSTLPLATSSNIYPISLAYLEYTYSSGAYLYVEVPLPFSSPVTIPTYPTSTTEVRYFYISYTIKLNMKPVYTNCNAPPVGYDALYIGVDIRENRFYDPSNPLPYQGTAASTNPFWIIFCKLDLAYVNPVNYDLVYVSPGVCYWTVDPQYATYTATYNCTIPSYDQFPIYYDTANWRGVFYIITPPYVAPDFTVNNAYISYH